MSDSLQQINVKIGKRLWRLRIVNTTEPIEEVTELVGGNQEDAVDILIIDGVDEALRARWEEWRQRSDQQWVARLLEAYADEELRRLLPVTALVIGPPRLVERFCRAVEPENATDPEASSVIPPTLGENESGLPEPSEIPLFAEEGKFDPFGLNLAMQTAAWMDVAGFVAELTADAHRQGFAVTLPPPPPGLADADLKPWRTIVPINGVETEPAIIERLSEEYSEQTDSRLSSPLDLLQRCSLIGATMSSGEREIWNDFSLFLEHLGYLVLSKEIDIEWFPALVRFFEIGAWAARAHSRSVLHGDMHPGNFGFSRDSSKLGERALAVDFGDSRFHDRPLTEKERAQDLAILKTQCSFLEWEAAKLGYQFNAGEIASKVFEFV